MHRLAAAGCVELVHLGCTVSAGQELEAEAEGKAAPECFELELGGIGGRLSQPFGQWINHAGPACLGGPGRSD